MDESDKDSYTILIDGLWPRGIKKDAIRRWMKELAPSKELREWYSHRDDKWEEFREKYKRELNSKRSLIDDLIKMNSQSKIIIVYSSRGQHTNADVLQEFIKELYGPEYLE